MPGQCPRAAGRRAGRKSPPAVTRTAEGSNDGTTVKAYSEELNHLTAEVARLGGLAEAQLSDAIEAVARRDVPIAHR